MSERRKRKRNETPHAPGHQGTDSQELDQGVAGDAVFIPAPEVPVPVVDANPIPLSIQEMHLVPDGVPIPVMEPEMELEQHYSVPLPSLPPDYHEVQEPVFPGEGLNEPSLSLEYQPPPPSFPPEVHHNAAPPDVTGPDLKSQPGSCPEVDLDQILNHLFLDDSSKELEVDFEPLGVPFESISKRDVPLYSGASITLHQSFVSILTLALTFKLTGVCLNAILSLISLHLPKDNNFKPSLSSFKNYFSHLQSKKDYLYFCSVCYAKCEKTGCSNPKHVDAKVCALIKIPLIEQLQTLFKREGFYAKLKFLNDDYSPGKYTDACDGNVYQDEIKAGRLGKDGNISLSWYTDGIALYESSQISVWPFYMNILNLPYEERNKKNNTLLPLVWCGPVKPPANILISQLYPDLKQLAVGLPMDVANMDKKVISGYVISGTGDTPARSMMMNIVQFNGESSCQRCEQPGEPRFDNPGVRIFPYRPNEMVPRSVDRMVQFGQMATPKKACVGVKGVPPLNCIMSDPVRGVAVDAMHLIYGGVGKKVLHLLTTSTKDKKYSIKDKVDIINELLLGIRPPAHMSQISRSLIDAGYWKMKEHKAFLLEYSLPLLKKLVSSNHLKHHGSLVAGVQLLSADIVTTEALSTARSLLHKYVSQFPDFYEMKYMTTNFHLLLHLDEVVRDLGPLWVHTCFPMESINGVILSLVHGTRWAERQIGDSVQVCLGHSELLRNLPNSESKTFCNKILNRNKLVSSAEVNNCKIIGGSTHVNELPTDVLEFVGLDTKVHELRCIKIKRFIYVALSKQNPMARRDSTAAVYNWKDKEEVGIITNLYRKFECNCPELCSCSSIIYAVIQKLEKLSSFETLIDGITVPNVAEYRIINSFCIVEAVSLIGVCTKIAVGSDFYVSKPCNTKEVE